MNEGPEWSSELNYAGKISEGKLISTGQDEVERAVDLKKMKLEKVFEMNILTPQKEKTSIERIY